MSSSTSATTNTAATAARGMSVDVLDPVARTVLTIPESKLLATRGLDEYRRHPGSRDISLCCLFQRGKCRADAACRQVHAQRAFVAHLRANKPAQACCAACRGVPEEADGVELFGRATSGMPEIPRQRILPTLGCKDPAACAIIDWATVCRLQLQDTCKYGDSCRNVHICPTLGKMLLARAAMNVNAVVPDSIRRQASVNSDDIVTQPLPAAAEEPPLVVAPVEAHPQAVADVPIAVPTAQVVVAEAPTVPVVPAPRALRAKFPCLDEGSLKIKDNDLEGLVFNLPTLASTSSDGTAANRRHAASFDRFDLFSPSPMSVGRTVCSPSTVSPSAFLC